MAGLAAAGALRARMAFAPADRAEQIEHLHAHLVSVQMYEPAWRPAIQITLVIARWADASRKPCRS
ncbi:hypothetical protein [Solirubrobacter soli]|uniref:hypothetical protein n=1 Tax=Solirubrobacter soli TaxID=363832 RepID=UPI000562649F|nr:hypothetical protein [Solirubrobacter soli]